MVRRCFTSTTMRVPTLLIVFLQAVLAVKKGVVDKSPPKIFGYLGESITLPSGVDPSWNLTKIEWSIFANITWIATYRDGIINTERVPQYTGRLTLNTRSGDLTIHNLKESDATEYTVDLRNSEEEDKINKIKLTAKLQTAAVDKSPPKLFGYLGENITLLSGADQSWNLTKIEWSIFTNNTWIATYRNGIKITERVPQYTGRLTLNTRSGDLTIHNLKESDAIQYTVDLRNSEGKRKTNQIKIMAKQKLQQPSIQIVTSTSVESGCLMVVNCSSLDEGVNLSWSVEPVSVLTINKSNPSDGSAQLFAFVNTKENFASFTCISSRDTESVSSKPVTPKCDSKICDSNCTTPPSPTTETQSCAGKIVVSVIVTLGICGIIFYMIYRYKVQSYSPQGDLLWIIQTVVGLVQRRRGVQRRTENPGEALQNQEDQVHLQIQEAASQNDVTSLCPAAAVAVQRPREEEQKRNQNEDSNKRASEQKDTIQHKEENRELEQEQEEANGQIVKLGGKHVFMDSSST